MKRLLCFILGILTVIASLFGLTACGTVGENDFAFYCPDGAPALALAGFIHDDEQFGQDKKITYHVVSGTEISAAATEKKAGFIIMPVNTATKIYNQKDSPYVMAAVITHGNFYIMSSTELSSASDLVGKVIYVPMRGKVPDWTFLSVLKANEIEYVESDTAVSGKVAIKYFNEGSDVVKALPKDNDGSIVGLIPEPAATNVSKSKTAYAYRLDLQELFDSVSKTYPQAVLMVKKSVADNNAALVNAITNAFAEKLQWTKSNVGEAVSAIKNIYAASTLNAATLSATVIENCKIYWQGSAFAKDSVKSYISRIRGIDASSANEVDDTFFM